MNSSRIIAAYRRGVIDAYGGKPAQFLDCEVTRAAYAEGRELGVDMMAQASKSVNAKSNRPVSKSFQPDFDGQKPVDELTGDQLLEEIRSLSNTTDNGMFQPREWVFDRLTDAREELDKRLRNHDNQQKELVQSFAYCLGAIHSSLWTAHNGRRLTGDEEARLHKLLFEFYKEIK